SRQLIGGVLQNRRLDCRMRKAAARRDGHASSACDRILVALEIAHLTLRGQRMRIASREQHDVAGLELHGLAIVTLQPARAPLHDVNRGIRSSVDLNSPRRDEFVRTEHMRHQVRDLEYVREYVHGASHLRGLESRLGRTEPKSKRLDMNWSDRAAMEPTCTFRYSPGYLLAR